MKRKHTFKMLTVGQKFEFTGNSFYDTCIKISARKYKSLDTGKEYEIGSVSAEVKPVK
jgi:hypothetical protein